MGPLYIYIIITWATIKEKIKPLHHMALCIDGRVFIFEAELVLLEYMLHADVKRPLVYLKAFAPISANDIACPQNQCSIRP